MQRIQDAGELDDILSKNDQGVIIGFFGDFSAAAKKARPHFEAFCAQHEDQPAVLVDVGHVRGAHRRFGVTTVPTVLLAKGNQVLRKVVGFQTPDFYQRSLLAPTTGARRARSGEEDARPAHSVVLYVGDSCPWCTRARNYLRKHGVPFREVNVSRDESEMMSLVSRSGQRGVPQLNIDGHWIIGFDKPRINQLIGLAEA